MTDDRTPAYRAPIPVDAWERRRLRNLVRLYPNDDMFRERLRELEAKLEASRA